MRELELLEHIYSHNAALPDHVAIPPGDDMAAVRLGGPDAQAVLITVDQVADGVHFDLANTPIEKIARKAVTRSLSDIAAMAALPVAAVAAASLPRGFGDDRATALFDAMRSVAAQYDCPLVGGDIMIADRPLSLSVTALARAQGIGPVTRRGARHGDTIYVTGQLGGSQQTLDGYTHHLDFEPRINLARQLARDHEIHCMLDLSDGLAIDLARLCRPADPPLTAEIAHEHLPVSAAAQIASHDDGVDAWRHALGDGEDYELCFTAPAKQPGMPIPTQIDGVAITPIGIMTEADNSAHSPVRIKLADGSVEPIDGLGWEHRG